MNKDWRKIEYYVPIEEALMGTENNNCVMIKGTAINECTTRNGVQYMAEELSKAAPSLRNKPVLKDHNNSVDSIVGKTTSNVIYNEALKKVDFEAKITDPKMMEMINQGLVSNVSIGAMVQAVERLEDGGPVVARGIDFVEISLVAVPADPNAGFAKAMMESFELKNSTLNIPEIKTEKIKEEIKMEEKKMSDEVNEKFEEQKRILEEQNTSLLAKLKAFEEKEMFALRESYKTLATEKGVSVKAGYENMTREILEAVIETLKSLKTIEVKEEVKKVESKAEVTEKAPTVDVSNYKFERAEKKGFAFSADNLSKIHPAFSR